MSQKLLAAASAAALVLACVAGWAISNEQASLVRDHAVFAVPEGAVFPRRRFRSIPSQ